MARNGVVDFFRFVFSILIVFCHMYLCPSFFNGNVVWFKSASIGVEFFFILSGFLMAKSALRYKNDTTGKATIAFIVKKWGGIFPMYFFAYCLSLIIKVFLNYGSIFELISGSFFELFFLQMTGLSPLLNNTEYMVGASWYISAMLISMFVLFPMLHKNRDIFLNVIAPILIFVILGFFCNEYGKFEFANHLGLLRATAELCIGCICYPIVMRLKNIIVSKNCAVLLTALEFSCYLGVLFGSWKVYRGEWDFIVVFIIALGLVISFSGLSYSSKIFNHAIFFWLGKYSLAIYLNHVIWLNLLQNLNMPLPVWLDICLVMLLTLTSSMVCVFTTDVIKDLWKVRGSKVKKYFILGEK